MCVNIMLVIKEVIFKIPKLWLWKPFRGHNRRSEGHGMKAIAPGKLSYLFQVHPSLHGLTGSAVQYFLAEPSPDPIIRFNTFELTPSTAYWGLC